MEPLERVGEHRLAPRGDAVVAAWRTAIVVRLHRIFPVRLHIAVALEPRERWIHGAARKLGAIHDVEAVATPSAIAWSTDTAA